jgi:uncharacterized protein YndB with AHSA1/START domain
MPTVIENTVEIARSPEDVFDYLSDQGNEIHWNPDCVSMEKLTPGPVGVGTKFRAKWKQGPVVYTQVTAFERPRTWTYENGGMISCILTATLEPTDDGGTRMTAHGLWSGHGIGRLFFPIFIRSMRKTEVQVAANFRRALEEGRDRVQAVASSS